MICALTSRGDVLLARNKINLFFSTIARISTLLNASSYAPSLHRLVLTYSTPLKVYFNKAVLLLLTTFKRTAMSPSLHKHLAFNTESAFNPSRVAMAMKVSANVFKASSSPGLLHFFTSTSHATNPLSSCGAELINSLSDIGTSHPLKPASYRNRYLNALYDQ